MPVDFRGRGRAATGARLTFTPGGTHVLHTPGSPPAVKSANYLSEFYASNIAATRAISSAGVNGF